MIKLKEQNCESDAGTDTGILLLVPQFKPNWLWAPTDYNNPIDTELSIHIEKLEMWVLSFS